MAATGKESSPLMGSEPNTAAWSKEAVDRPSSWKEAQDRNWKPPDYSDEKMLKAAQRGFLVKVYSILSLQLLVTVGFCFFFMHNASANSFVLGNQWMFWVCFILSIVIIIALFFLKNKYPVNMILLGAFTLVESYTVGMICAMYQEKGVGELVGVAWAITFFIFVALTIFIQNTDIDFSFLGLFLPIALMVLIFWGLISLLFGLKLGFAYSAVGALIFAGYIIYDSQQIMKMSLDDHVIAAIELYLDIINLFLMILSLLSGGDR